MHLAPVREIIRSGELAALGSVMVKRATGSRETTGAGGAEVRRTYRHGLLTSLTDEFKNESNTFARLQKRRETQTLVWSITRTYPLHVLPEASKAIVLDLFREAPPEP
jgi:hypothetical protein